MRHRVSGYKLNRRTNQRRGLFKNLISEVILHGSITTTYAKAKAVQPQLERVITKAKAGSLHKRRQVDAVLNQRHVVNKVCNHIAPHTNRSSGYSRIIKLGRRKGDNSLMVKLELVEYPKVDHKPSPAKPTKTGSTPKKPTKSTSSTSKPSAPKKTSTPSAPKKKPQTSQAKVAE